MMKQLISLVIINWNNKSYIDRCMESILSQKYNNIEIIFIDNDSADGSFEHFDEKYSSQNIMKVHNKVNNGYAGAANQGIKLSNGSYVMIINPDIIMEPDFIGKLYDFCEADSSVAAISGKLLKYDFKKDEKLNFIDSAGIVMYRSRRCVDRGQNEADNGQYNKVERVFGVCGAAPMYKKEALEKIKIDEEYFDEDFFAYKEDVDLSWRLNLCGYKCMYYPEAVAYHGRGMGGSKGGVLNFIRNRKTQSEFLRGISFRNHYMMMFKNETENTYGRDRFKIWKRSISFMCYAIVFERFTFKYLSQALNMKQKMLSKKKAFYDKVSVSDKDVLDLLQ